MDIVTKAPGSQFLASELNQIVDELENVISDTGQTPSNVNFDQVGIGLAAYVGNADAYQSVLSVGVYELSVIGTNQAIPAYVDGNRIRFRPVVNTLAAPQVDVVGLGAVDLVHKNGDTIEADYFPGSIVVEAIFSAGGNHYELTTDPYERKQPTIQIFFSPGAGTWTKPAGCKYIIVECIGGGGGGGGSSNGNYRGGGGGGGGAYNRTYINVTTVASFPLVVGDFGAGGGAIANGLAGGSTSFNVITVANGGGGGLQGGQIHLPNGGGSTGGDFNVDGSSGGFGSNAGSVIAISGQGGGSFLGGGAPGQVVEAAGIISTVPGSGGSGGCRFGATSASGGNGATGRIIVTEFYGG